MEQSHDKLKVLLIYVALGLTTFIAFEQVRHNGFVNYDDYAYVTENPHINIGVTRESFFWAFTNAHRHMWHPLTSLSHMLDCQLFGLKPHWHHTTSLLFHMGSVLLLFGSLKKMTGAVWQSFFVAALFGLHPLQVESVAWVAERKNVLSGFFWMLTIATYIQYAERPGMGRYLLVVLTFGLGLMAKPMVVTLPFVLLLLDYWPLGRFKWASQSAQAGLQQTGPVKVSCQASPTWRLIAEKIPLLILAAILGVITFIAQRVTMFSTEMLPLNLRIANAVVSYLDYIIKMVYPTRLAVFYPLLGSTKWNPIISFIILACVSTGILYMARRRRYLVVGWLWYLGTLVPVIGLVQVGAQAMADRYTYLPSVGIFIMVAWGANEFLAKWRYRRIGLGILAGLLLGILLVVTRIQVRHWQDSITLSRHAVEVTENNYIMHHSYGLALAEKGQINEALIHFRETLRINPKFSKARQNMGEALLKQGKLNEAIACFNQVSRTRTNRPHDLYASFGIAHAQLGEYDVAIAHWTEALKFKPDSANVLNNLAWMFATHKETKFRDSQEAIRLAERACELANYEEPALLDTLAASYAAAGRFGQAIETAKKALKLAEAAGEKDLAQEIQSRLHLYKTGQPYRAK